MQLVTHSSGVVCKTSVRALNIALLLSMISPAVRELGVVQVDWLLKGTPPSSEFSVCAMIGVFSADKFITYLERL